MKKNLAYQISRNLSHISCQLHHMGLATQTSKEMTIIKVCCGHFKEDVVKEVEKLYTPEFVNLHIRFRLPISDISGVTSSNESN